MALEELLQRDRERLGVAQLAADDDAVLERLADRLDELRRAPLLTRAAAICEPPILSPTIFFALPPPRERAAEDGAAGIESASGSSFGFGFGSEAGSAASHSFGPRLSESSPLVERNLVSGLSAFAGRSRFARGCLRRLLGLGAFSAFGVPRAASA